MDMKRKLGATALGLALVAAAAGTGWALQRPESATPRAAKAGDAMDTEAGRKAIEALEAANSVEAAKAAASGLSLLAWPQPAAEPEGGAAKPDEEAAEREDADDDEDIEGLEEMSATGTASPQR